MVSLVSTGGSIVFPVWRFANLTYRFRMAWDGGKGPLPVRIQVVVMIVLEEGKPEAELS